jgi:hypothetical protein
MPLDSPTRHPPGSPRLEARLRRELQGEVLFDPFSRGRYSTDASIYQIEPLGVVVPKDRRCRAGADNRTCSVMAGTLSIRGRQRVPIHAEEPAEVSCRVGPVSILLDCVAQGHLTRRRGLINRKSLTINGDSIGIAGRITHGHRTHVDI